jgi:hypothetical protein
MRLTFDSGSMLSAAADLSPASPNALFWGLSIASAAAPADARL